MAWASQTGKNPSEFEPQILKILSTQQQHFPWADQQVVILHIAEDFPQNLKMQIHNSLNLSLWFFEVTVTFQPVVMKRFPRRRIHPRRRYENLFVHRRYECFHAHFLRTLPEDRRFP